MSLRKAEENIPTKVIYKLILQIFLFIVGGAFQGIENILKDRLEKNLWVLEQKLNQNLRIFSEIIKNLRPEDLLKYGLIPEFVGRIPMIVTLEGLNEIL